MSSSGDDLAGMGMTVLDDEAMESFFRGDANGAWAQDATLAGLVDQVHAAAAGPAPRPGPALLAFLAQPGPVSAATRVATPAPVPWPSRSVPAPAARIDRRHDVGPFVRRLRLTVGIAVAGVAAAVLALAATTDVLPEPAMRAVSRVVEAVTPFELPGPAPVVTSPEHGPAATVPLATLPRPRPVYQDVTPSQPPSTEAPSRGPAQPPGPPASMPAGVAGSVPPPGASASEGGGSPAAPPFGPGPPAGVVPPAIDRRGPPSTAAAGPPGPPAGPPSWAPAPTPAERLVDRGPHRAAN